MNNAVAVSPISEEMKAQVSTREQVLSEGNQMISHSRRARPPAKWSLRIDMPLVRESMRDAAGSAVRARSPSDIAALCEDIRLSAQEAFIVVDVNAKNNVIDKRLV